jgi:hypothetical protein
MTIYSAFIFIVSDNNRQRCATKTNWQFKVSEHIQVPYCTVEPPTILLSCAETLGDHSNWNISDTVRIFAGVIVLYERSEPTWTLYTSRSVPWCNDQLCFFQRFLSNKHDACPNSFLTLQKNVWFWQPNVRIKAFTRAKAARKRDGYHAKGDLYLIR